MNITKWMNRAQQLSKKSTCTEWGIGAVYIVGGKNKGEGFNRYSAKFETISKRFGVPFFSLHAEMDAIFSSGCIEGGTLFVAGIKNNGRKVNCKPCKSCMKVISHLGINVYYETKEGIQYVGC